MAADVPTWQTTVKDTLEKINTMPVIQLCFGIDNKVKKSVNWSDNIFATLARCCLGIWRCVIVILEILQAHQMTADYFPPFIDYAEVVPKSLLVLGLVVCISVAIWNAPAPSIILVGIAGIGCYAAFRMCNAHQMTADYFPPFIDYAEVDGAQKTEQEPTKVRSSGGFSSLASSGSAVLPLWVPTQFPNIDLDIKAMLELEEMQKKLGSFSYYNYRGSTIVVHAEDEIAQSNNAVLREKVHVLVKRCAKNPDAAEVIFAPHSFNMELCGHIGASMRVKDNKQVTGIYLDHGGLAYWASVAHNAITYTKGKNSKKTQVEENGRLHTSSTICSVDGINFSGNNNNQVAIQAPTPYACCMGKPKDTNGKILMHTVDLMIGQLPLLTCYLEEGASYPGGSGMREVRRPCLDCRAFCCTQLGHRRGEIQYSIRRLFSLNYEIDGRYSQYKIPTEMWAEVMNKELHSYSLERGVMRGRIVAHQGCSHKFNINYVALNAVYIIPLGSTTPMIGDCGSVWVLEGTTEAIAMTIAMGNLPETLQSEYPMVWLAEFLIPCFEALRGIHRAKFRNTSYFVPIFGDGPSLNT